MNNLTLYLFALVLSVLIHCTLFLSAPELKKQNTKNFSDKVQGAKFRVVLEYREQEKKQVFKKSKKKVKKVLKEKVKKIEKKSDEKKDHENTGEDTEKARYLAAVRNQINEHKFVSRIARKLGLRGEVHFTFNIYKPNKIQNLRISKSSGFKALDRSAVQSISAIRDSLPAIPESLKVNLLEIRGILVYD